MLKLLWKYFPTILKKYLFPSTILLSIISTLAYSHISGQNISISLSALLQLVIAFGLYSIVIAFIGFFIAYNRIIYYLYTSKKDPADAKPLISEEITSKTKKEKKYIPNQFELEVLNYNLIEYTVFITRRWYPNEKPGIESFISEIGFSEPRCGKCHSDFYKHYGSTDYSDCTNPGCSNKQKFWSDDLYSINQQLQINFKGKVRNNYEEYWEKYKKIYDDFTNKNYEDYYEPRR